MPRCPIWSWALGGVPRSHLMRAPLREPHTIVHFISHFADDKTELWMSHHWVLMKAISGVRASVTNAALWVLLEQQCPQGTRKGTARGQPGDSPGTGAAVSQWKRAGTCCLVLAPCCKPPRGVFLSYPACSHHELSRTSSVSLSIAVRCPAQMLARAFRLPH